MKLETQDACHFTLRQGSKRGWKIVVTNKYNIWCQFWRHKLSCAYKITRSYRARDRHSPLEEPEYEYMSVKQCVINSHTERTAILTQLYSHTYQRLYVNSQQNLCPQPRVSGQREW